MQYQPHEYQKYATNFVLKHPVAAVLLEMGLGKSVITLTAIYELMLNRFEVESVLVIGPLRVARDTWPAEIEKWEHLQGLTYSVAYRHFIALFSEMFNPPFLRVGRCIFPDLHFYVQPVIFRIGDGQA